MLPEAVRTLATNAYKLRVHDEYLEMVVDLKSLQEQFAYNHIVGGPAVRQFVERGRKFLRKRAVIAAEELQRACESTGVASYRTLASDLRDAWTALLAEPTMLNVEPLLESYIAPHVSSAGAGKDFWRNAVDVATNDGKREADDVLNHFAAQRLRDHSRTWRDRVIGIGGTAAGFVAGHIGDIVKWVVGIVHR